MPFYVSENQLIIVEELLRASRFTLYTMSGKEIGLLYADHRRQVDLSDFKPGIYLLEAAGVASKIIIQ